MTSKTERKDLPTSGPDPLDAVLELCRSFRLPDFDLAARRLEELDPRAPRHPLDAGDRREHWMRQGQAALDGGDGAAAYKYFFRAGWDDLIMNDIHTVLRQLMTAAEMSNSSTLAALARLHLGASEAQNRAITVRTDTTDTAKNTGQKRWQKWLSFILQRRT